MPFAKYKARYLVIAAAVLLILSVIVHLLVSTYNSYTETIIRQQQQRLLTVARSVSGNLEQHLSEQMRDVEILVKVPGFISEMREYYQNGTVDGAKEYMLSYMMAQYMGFSRIYLLDKDGRELFRYGKYPFIEDFDESLLELERLSRMKYNSIGGVFKINPHRYGLTTVNTVYAGNEYLGCVVGLIDIDMLYSQFVAPLGLRDSEFLTVKDESGSIMMHPTRDMIGLNVFTELGKLSPENRPRELADMMERQYAYEEGTALYHPHTWGVMQAGDEEISAYTRVNVTGVMWVVSAIMPLSQAIRPVRDGLAQFVLLTVIIFSIVVLAVALIYILQKKRQRLALQARYLKDINNTLEELHQSREQIRHYQKLQTIGALAGGIVHEFNNLLTPIMGYCEFLLERMGDDSEYGEDLREIHKAGGRAKEIIEQILPFSRRESDAFGYTVVSVDAIMKDAVKMVRLIMPSSISLQEDFQDTGINVFGSATQLNQVLLNLCTNAYQAMDQGGGVLQVRCRPVSAGMLPEQYLSTETMGGYVEISVADTGCGMSREVADRVFDAFFTTKKAGEGTGLGLAVAQDIVQNHKGVITLDTAPGKGSRFSIYLPATSAPVLSKADVRPAQENARRQLTVLLIDDDHRVARYLKKRMQKSGYLVDAYTSAENGMDAFRASISRWDLVILDYTMPVYKGTDLARWIKKERPELPVFLITGLVEKEALQMKREGVLDEILIKPIDYQELMEAAGKI